MMFFKTIRYVGSLCLSVGAERVNDRTSIQNVQASESVKAKMIRQLLFFPNYFTATGELQYPIGVYQREAQPPQQNLS